MEDVFFGEETPPPPALKPIKKVAVQKIPKPTVQEPNNSINETKEDIKVEDSNQIKPEDDTLADLDIDIPTEEPVKNEEPEIIDEPDSTVDDTSVNTEVGTSSTDTADTESKPEPDNIDIAVDLDETKIEEDSSETTVVDSENNVDDENKVVALPDIPNLSLNENLNSDISIDETDNKMTEMILKELEKENALKNKLEFEDVERPEDPPHYLSSGKNLVYNCVDGHWACIDDSDYKICQAHFAYNKKNSKQTSCFPERDYENAGECEAVQQYKINTIVKTQFCN